MVASSWATSAAARPESITAASTAVCNRVEHRSRTGSSTVAGVNVRRPHAGSANTNLGLRTTTSTRLACGTSRPRCTDQECTLVDTTPQAGPAVVLLDRLHLDSTTAQRQVDGVDHPGAGQVEITLAASRRKPRRLGHSSWLFTRWMQSNDQNPSEGPWSRVPSRHPETVLGMIRCWLPDPPMGPKSWRRVTFDGVFPMRPRPGSLRGGFSGYRPATSKERK